MVCGWHFGNEENVSLRSLSRWHIVIASAAAVASSSSEALAMSRPVRSVTMVWKFSSASRRPWEISAWYGVYCVYQPGFSKMLRWMTGGRDAIVIAHADVRAENLVLRRDGLSAASASVSVLAAGSWSGPRRRMFSGTAAAISSSRLLKPMARAFRASRRRLAQCDGGQIGRDARASRSHRAIDLFSTIHSQIQSKPCRIIRFAAGKSELDLKALTAGNKENEVVTVNFTLNPNPNSVPGWRKHFPVRS